MKALALFLFVWLGSSSFVLVVLENWLRASRKREQRKLARELNRWFP